MYPDAEEVQAAMQIFLERSLPKLQGIESSWLTSAGQWLQQHAPKALTQQVQRYCAMTLSSGTKLRHEPMTCLPVVALLFTVTSSRACTRYADLYLACSVYHSVVCQLVFRPVLPTCTHADLQGICCKHVAAAAEAHMCHDNSLRHYAGLWLATC